MTMRDEVALIIDPESIKGRESYAALPSFVSPEAAQKAADYQFGEAIKEAYAKADAILALSPPEPTEGLREALTLAEDVLSRAPFSTQIWPNGMHPNEGIALIRAALRAMPLQDHGWQDISTAPKDGSEFLALNKRATVVGYRVVYFDDEAKEPYIWHVEDAGKGFNHHRDFFTHWQPLPAAPGSMVAEDQTSGAK